MSSLKEIAQLAGVSPSTVSRVLNNPGHRCSSEEVRQRIWRIAREQNYLPNEAARNLKLGLDRRRDAPIVHIDVLFTRFSSTHADPFFNEMFRLVEGEVHKSGGFMGSVWHNPVFSGARSSNRADSARFVAKLLDGTAVGPGDGLIILGKCERSALEALAGRYKAVVSVNRNPVGFVVDEVTCDGRLIALRAVEYLHALGHRRIGFAGQCADDSLHEGYQQTLALLGLPIDPRAMLECERTESAGFEAMDRLLACDEAPSAIFCSNDIIAVGMIRRLAHTKGQYYRPSLIGVDDIEEGQFVRPMLTSIGLPKADMARTAVRLLMDRMGDGHAECASVRFDCRLIERESCFPIDEADGGQGI